MNRRTFLKVASMGSVGFAATSCTSPPEKTLYSFVNAPDDMVTGKALWYATTCRECPAGCGLLAKNRDGRIIKVEGNPGHPINKGRLCVRGQAQLQGIYNPDRLTQPLVKKDNRWISISFPEALNTTREKIALAAKGGSNRISMITEHGGEPLMDLMRSCLKGGNSERVISYEAFSYESLKKAYEILFGTPMLPSYHMERSDMLLSFGADFLETFLSPVEYSRKFKTMHGYNNGKKGLFIQVSPFKSLTGANADQWISCRSDSEVFIVLGLLHRAIRAGRGKNLPKALKEAIEKVSRSFSPAKIIELTDITLEDFNRVASTLLKAQSPLILGPGVNAQSETSYKTDLAVLLLNIVLDPNLSLFDFNGRHGIEEVSTYQEMKIFCEGVKSDGEHLLLINNTNPSHTLSPKSPFHGIFSEKAPFTIAFSNFMDETTLQSDLIIPTKMPLEVFDTFNGKRHFHSMLQPVMAASGPLLSMGDILLRLMNSDPMAQTSYQQHIMSTLKVESNVEWFKLLAQGGSFGGEAKGGSKRPAFTKDIAKSLSRILSNLAIPEIKTLELSFYPSARFFDGRGANRPFLSEIPDPITKVAWQTPVLIHPNTAKANHLTHGRWARIENEQGSINAPVYFYHGIREGMAAIAMGQGHTAYGRYAKDNGSNPFLLSPDTVDTESGGMIRTGVDIRLKALESGAPLANTDGSANQHGRKIALSVDIDALKESHKEKKHGLTMHDFPLTLPLPEGYDASRDLYPPHEHVDYRWAMVIDLDRCIGCSACVGACYAENNIGIVGEKEIINGREMSWMRIERYQDSENNQTVTFLPMMCQHCDNAPCEAVCPVYAPHHSKEGLNNQIYNRCIGTRFCAQNCPYKVRRFNWYEWKWPEPMNLMLNPNVTVRSKGVMEKCSFCIQRIKEAHSNAKNEKRRIKENEVVPACMQTCPTQAISFGDLKAKGTALRKMVEDQRAYQVMGYLNTKPAVIYLKKVVQKI